MAQGDELKGPVSARYISSLILQVWALTFREILVPFHKHEYFERLHATLHLTSYFLCLAEVYQKNIKITQIPHINLVKGEEKCSYVLRQVNV
jgi:hypothetical protein